MVVRKRTPPRLWEDNVLLQKSWKLIALHSFNKYLSNVFFRHYSTHGGKNRPFLKVLILMECKYLEVMGGCTERN